MIFWPTQPLQEHDRVLHLLHSGDRPSLHGHDLGGALLPRQCGRHGRADRRLPVHHLQQRTRPRHRDQRPHQGVDRQEVRTVRVELATGE